ncbi:MAG: hypothetical protein LUM44_17640 [Pyrinomonadaceae bacterium]|nr:hypothetical protein [Pyrinomonadaceae bacterium]
MAKKTYKFKTKSHLQDVNGDIIAPDTIVEAEKLGDDAVIERYLKLEAIEEVGDKDEVEAEAETETESEGDKVSGKDKKK